MFGGVVRFGCRMTRRYAASIDPLRRRRVRSIARGLVSERAWSGTKATKDEIARLALLRVLWLQQQVRRAGRSGQGEATAMLARASIEAAITGLYCIYVPDAAERFEGETGRSVMRLLKGLTEGVAGGVLEAAVRHLGSAGVPRPQLMVEQIVANGGPPGTSALYDNYYNPLSGLYLHGGPVGLMRHVHPSSDLTRARPFRVWSKRSAVHTADAMVGLLAAAIAGVDHRDYQTLASYEAAHWGVTWTPLFFISRGLAVTRIQLRHVPALIAVARRLRAQVARGEKVSEANADEVIEAITRVTGADPNEPALGEVIRALRSRLLAGAEVDS